MQFHNSTADFFVPDGTRARRRDRAHHAPLHRRAPGRYRDHGLPRRRRVLRPRGQVVHRRGGHQRRRQPAHRHLWRLHRRADAEGARDRAAQGRLRRRVRLPDPARLHQRAVKNPKETAVVADLEKILLAARPEVVYLHNPADKHDTHVGVTLRAIAALRDVRDRVRPERSTAAKSGAIWTGCRTRTSRCCGVSARPNIAAVAGGRFRFAGQRRQALRPGHRGTPRWPTPLTSPRTAPTRRRR